MISFHNILSIAKYERKTLLRSWFFRIFSILSLLVLFGMNFGMIIEGGGGEGWAVRSIPSAIPYFNILILNVAQAIIAVFLASDFLKRDKKLDTTEVIYMRSMTNGEYVIGKTWGNLQVFLVLNILVVVMALIFNMLSQGTAIDFASYAIYIVLISIPTLVFIMGLAFLLMSIIRNQAITFVVILGYIGITLFLVQAKFYYLFDYMAFNIPMLNSGIVGFGNLEVILGHRGIYFSLGLGFIFLAIFMLKRLPQSETMTYISLFLSVLFIGAGGYLGYSHIQRFKLNEHNRTEAVELNNKYVPLPVPEIVSNAISLEHNGNTIAVDASIQIKNSTGKNLQQLVFSLNSGLKVKHLKLNGTENKFNRENHLIVISENVAKIANGEEAKLEIQYEGKIDEALCYLDIDEKTLQEKHGAFVINVDKRFAFVNPEYVLLTKEANWYPKPGVTYSSTDASWNQPQFSKFSLRVKTSPSLTAISQGDITEITEGQFVFENKNPLTQISLSIGNYEHKEIQSKNMTFGLWYFKGHDFFSEALNEIKDTIPNILSERLSDFTRTYNLEYSFDKLSLVEVPAQFKTYERIWTSNQELVQPEQILIPEKGFLIRDADFKQQMKWMERRGRRGDESLTPDELQLRILDNFFGTFTREQGRPDWNRMGGGSFSIDEKANPYFIFPLIYNFQNNIKSDRWPIVNRIFEAYLKGQSVDMRSNFMRDVSGISEDEMANIALQDYTFEEILSDPEQKKIIDNVIKLKGDVLFSMVQWKAGQEEFEAFLRQILNENKFRNIRFEDFDAQIKDKFNIELSPLMNEWFQEKTLPGYLISPFEAIKVKTEDQIQTMVSFKITNFSDKEGIVKASFRLGGGRRGGFGGRGPGGGEPETIDKVIYLDAHQTKEVSYLLDADPRMLSINTLTSLNIPQTIADGFRDIEEDLKAKAFDGEKLSDKPVSMLLPNEIIVDNEDPGFSVTEEEHVSLLKKWIIKEDENKLKYSGMVPWNPPTKWTLTTNSDYYGEYVRSGYYIKSGDGAQKAKWSIPVKEPGYYDVYYHLVKPRRGRRNRGNDKGEYHFTIYHDDGTEEQTLETSTADEGWNQLGSFYFSPGNAAVELSNLSEMGTVTADAVKLIKL